MGYKVKKNDRVVLIAGKDKGKTGKVLFVDRKKGRVIVEGLNMVKKTLRPSQQNPKGGIIDIEAPVHISNVMVVCPKCDRGVRVKKKMLEDGKRVRVCGKCGEILDKV
ncbi:MAG: 50S ribosomal protein L24 [Spirochaetes bacterium]|nr:MAG: 50S ribosomal protein L24 [Spirochaetota bacterium]